MSQIVAQGISYSALPKDGPGCVYVRLVARDFYNAGAAFVPFPNLIANPDAFPANKAASAGGAAANQSGYLGGYASLDISQQMRLQSMEWLSSVYIDNSLGAGIAVLRHRPTGHTITAQPYTQGHYPLLLPRGELFAFDVCYVDSLSDNLATAPSFAFFPDTSADKSGGGGLYFGAPVESGSLRMQFTDVIVPPSVWSTRNWQTGIWYSYPRAIAVGGTYEMALPKNPFRKGFLIGNPAAPAEPVLMVLKQDGEVAAAANAISILNGNYYQHVGPPAYVGEVWVTTATAAHAVQVREFM